MNVRNEKSFHYTESTLQQASWEVGVGGGERRNNFATKAKGILWLM